MMSPKLLKLEEIWIVVIAILAALLLASHQLSDIIEFGLFSNYIYWLFRILMQAGIFIAVFKALDRYVTRLLPEWGLIALAIMISLIPYALTVTAFDLILGLPEIGFNDNSPSQMSTLQAFGYELLFLLDNHAVLCLMLLLPRLFLRKVFMEPEAVLENAQIDDPETLDQAISFINFLEPPLQGELCSVEAQEHYVRVISTAESRMVLYRFSDVVRQLPDSLGSQVHRSHWVAYSAVSEIVMQGQTIKLALKDGRFVPVSRTFRNDVEARFGTS